MIWAFAQQDWGDMIMTTWQKIGCAAVCIIALVSVLLGIVFYATSGAAEAADEFFAATNAGEYERAQSFTSQRLRQSTTPDDLKAFVEESGLTDVADTSWSNRSIEGSTGELSGTVTTGSGGTIPMTILFVSENDEWKIDGFDIQGGDLSAGSASTGSDANSAALIDPELRRLAAQRAKFHTGNLADAWKRDDFEYFSEWWDDDPSPAKLAEDFARRDVLSDEDIASLSTANPVINQANRGEDGLIWVEAEFGLVNGKMRARYRFAPGEDDPDSWKIYSLDLNYAGY